MQQIKDYLEVMFKELPVNDQSVRLKKDMLNSMEEKYEEALREGKTEAEAIGGVIGAFGSMDDLKEVFGEMQGDAVSVSDEQVVGYMNYIPTFAKQIALGVALILLGVGLVPFMESLNLESVGIVIMFMTIAISVSLFIVSGFKLSSFGMAEITKADISQNSMDRVQKEMKAYQSRFITQLVSGIAMVLIAVMVAYILDEDVLNKTNLQATAFMFLLAIGVFLILHGSIRYGSLATFKELPDDRKKYAAYEKKDRIMGIFMIAATVIYLIAGFYNAGNFATYWVVFPIMALLGVLTRSIYEFFVD